MSFLSLRKQKALIKKARDDISLIENLSRYRSSAQIFRQNGPLGAPEGCHTLAS